MDFQVNLTSRRALLRWRPSHTQLSTLLDHLSQAGYPAQPYDRQRQETQRRAESRRQLRRLAVAGFGMMQIMMFAVALYAGDYQDMTAATRSFLRWTSLLVALPVVFYSAMPFFISAWQSIRNRRLNMDITVSIAIGSAFCASAWATVSNQGEVYFDSVAMFTFLLLLGRYLELNARATKPLQRPTV